MRRPPHPDLWPNPQTNMPSPLFHPCALIFSPPAMLGHILSLFLTKKIVLKEKICSLCKWIFYTILEVDPWQNAAHFSHFTWRFDGNAKVLIYVINQVLGILQNFILNQGRGYRYFWIFLIVWISGQASPPFQNKKPFWVSAWYRAAVDHRII